MNAPTIETALADITRKLVAMGRPFALVGGLAVSFRAEVRFTRDVDLAVVVKDDADFESLVFRNLLRYEENLDLEAVKDNLDRIVARGFHREEDLHAKLTSLPTGASHEE